MALGLCFDIMNLLNYSELLKNLVLRDLRLRYRNTGLGFLWSLVQPLTMFFVYYAVFGVLLTDKFGMGGTTYPFLLIIGLFTFNFFSGGVTKATPSIVQAGGLLKQVAFPRIVLPLSSVLAEGVHFLMMLLILILACFLKWWPSHGSFTELLPLLYLPLLLVLHLLVTLGVGLLLSTMNVFYRDTEQLANTFMTILFFGTPVLYAPPNLEKFQSLTFLSEKGAEIVYKIYYLNPMTHIIKSYRDVLLDLNNPDGKSLLMAFGLGILFFVWGLFVFKKSQSRFAEEI